MCRVFVTVYISTYLQKCCFTPVNLICLVFCVRSSLGQIVGYEEVYCVYLMLLLYLFLFFHLLTARTKHKELVWALCQFWATLGYTRFCLFQVGAEVCTTKGSSETLTSSMSGGLPRKLIGWLIEYVESVSELFTGKINFSKVPSLVSKGSSLLVICRGNNIWKGYIQNVCLNLDLYMQTKTDSNIKFYEKYK